MSTHKDAQRRYHRLTLGTGPRALRDPALTPAALARAGGWESVSIMANVLGIGNYPQYVREGFSIWQADRFAVKIGCHPAEVWGDAWWDAVERHQARFEQDLEVAS